MSLTLTLSNPNGIVMSADRRITNMVKCDIKSATSRYDSSQKLFLTKSGHGISYTGSMKLDDGMSVSAIIKYALDTLDSTSMSVKDELIYIKKKLNEHKNIGIISMTGAEVLNGIGHIYSTELLDNNYSDFVEDESNGNAATLYYGGEKELFEKLLTTLDRNFLSFPLQTSVDFLRLLNQTVATCQYFSDTPQTISMSCDILVIDNCGAHWFISPEQPQ